MKRVITLCGAVVLLAVQAQGQLFSSNGTGGGDWNDGATWVGGLAPGAAGDRGEINAGDTVTATADMDDVPIRIIEEFAGSAQAGTLNVGPGSTVSWFGGTSIIQSDVNINAPIRIRNDLGSAHIIFKGDAILTADKELWSDSPDTRFFAQENAQMIIGSAGGSVAMGASAPGAFNGLYVFGNGQLDLSNGRFWGGTYNRAILLQNADVGATVHVKDTIFQTPTSGVFISEAAAEVGTPLFERCTFEGVPERSFGISEMELVDSTFDEGQTLGDLVMFTGTWDVDGSGDPNRDYFALHYSSDTTGDYEMLVGKSKNPLSYQHGNHDPTTGSDVIIHPDTNDYQTQDSFESSAEGIVQLSEDGFCNSLTLAAGITFDLNGFTLFAGSPVDENGGTLLLNGGQVVVTGPVIGDANGDGAVDDADLSLLLATWGQDATGDPDGGISRGEFNEIAPVDDADLSLLLSNWTGAGAVPEPATLGLIAMGIGLPLSRRRRA